AKKTNSINTVYELEDGTFFGFNTDVYGIKRAISHLKNNLTILILGSGGVARSAIVALNNSNKLFLSARNQEECSILCNQFAITFVPWNKNEEREYDLIVNATPAGSDSLSIP
ncbi:MAG: hypothetical protein N2445_05165, partial [Acidobacteria bacterium]|nr:hypothetical protein [Acidobacteriota bacterium]